MDRGTSFALLVAALGTCVGAAHAAADCGSVPVALAVIVEPDPILLDDRLPSSERIDPVLRWRAKRNEERTDPAAWALLAPLTRELKRAPPGMALRNLLVARLRSLGCTISDTQVFQATIGDSLHEVNSLKRRMLVDRSAQDLLIVRVLLRLDTDAERIVGYIRVFSRRRGVGRADIEFDLEYRSGPVGTGASAGERVAAWAADGAARMTRLQSSLVDEILALLTVDLDADGARLTDTDTGRKGRLVWSSGERSVVRLGGRHVSRPAVEWKEVASGDRD